MPPFETGVGVEASAELAITESFSATVEISTPFAAISSSVAGTISGGPAGGSVAFAYTLVYGVEPELLTLSDTIILDGAGAGVFEVSLPETDLPLAPVPETLVFNLQANEYLDAGGGVWAGLVTFTAQVGFSLYAPPVDAAAESPAIPESLMIELRDLYAQLVTDTSVENDRLISIFSRTPAVGANGERTYTQTAISTTYGQAKYMTQSAASRALGRPTSERVVEITIPAAADFSPDFVYVVNDESYYPIPGENNLGTTYRAYTKFLAKSRT